MSLKLPSSNADLYRSKLKLTLDTDLEYYPLNIDSRNWGAAVKKLNEASTRAPEELRVPMSYYIIAYHVVLHYIILVYITVHSILM